MNGLSERLLVSHYVNNTGGAVRRLNAIRERLAGLDWTRAATFDLNGLKREVAVCCICGFQVSGKTVTELRQRGYNARALVGGITAWHAIGGASVQLDLSTYEDKLNAASG